MLLTVIFQISTDTKGEKCVKNVLPHSGNYRSTLSIYKSKIEEIRHVRNHCAHRSPDTKRKYNDIVKSKFGVKSNLSIHVFLLSEKRSNPCHLETYFVTIKALTKDLVRL